MAVSGAPVKKLRHAEPISGMALDTIEAVKNIKNPANDKPMTITIANENPHQWSDQTMFGEYCLSSWISWVGGAEGERQNKYLLADWKVRELEVIDWVWDSFPAGNKADVPLFESLGGTYFYILWLKMRHVVDLGNRDWQGLFSY